jgi:hypothetical protein
MDSLKLKTTNIRSSSGLKNIIKLEKNKNSEKWVFRGQFHNEWKLIPSFLRDEKELTKKVYPDNLSERMKMSDLFHYETKEIYSEYFMRNQRAEYIPRCEYFDHSADFRQFIEFSYQYSKKGKVVTPDEVLVPFLSYCQHRGMSTRLLDFSFSAEKAILFSQYDNCDLNQKYYGESESAKAAVFAINIYDQLVKETLKIYIPDYEINDNCNFQKGVMLYQEQQVGIVNKECVEYNDSYFGPIVPVEDAILDKICEYKKSNIRKYPSESLPIRKFVFDRKFATEYCKNHDLSINDLFVERQPKGESNEARR